MVAVPGNDAASVYKTISAAFHHFLHGRLWMPLRAQPCKHPYLLGQPMLDVLPAEMTDAALYNYKFLKEYCATLYPDGRIEALYIAMIDASLTWTEILQSPKSTDGLEECWKHDKTLDETSLQSQSAGQILSGSMIRSSKRTSSVLSRKSSFGSVEGEPSLVLAKRARLNCTESPDRLRKEAAAARAV